MVPLLTSSHTAPPLPPCISASLHLCCWRALALAACAPALSCAQCFGADGEAKEEAETREEGECGRRLKRELLSAWTETGEWEMTELHAGCLFMTDALSGKCETRGRLCSARLQHSRIQKSSHVGCTNLSGYRCSPAETRHSCSEFRDDTEWTSSSITWDTHWLSSADPRGSPDQMIRDLISASLDSCCSSEAETHWGNKPKDDYQFDQTCLSWISAFQVKTRPLSGRTTQEQETKKTLADYRIHGVKRGVVFTRDCW